jgi:hypothetical protein
MKISRTASAGCNSEYAVYERGLALAGQVDLGGRPAAGAAQAGIGSLGGYAAGRLGLQVPAPASTGTGRSIGHLPRP